MATVIDSLLIELGLDTTKFSASQKKAVDELQKFDEQSSKTYKNSQKSVNDLGNTVGKAKDALVSLGITLFSLKGLSNLASDVTKTNADLSRTAELFGMSARELDAWGNVMKKVGGTSDDFTASIQSIQGALAKVPFGDQILEPIAILGAQEAVDLQNARVDVLKLADAIKKYRDIHGEQAAFVQAQAMGINRNFFMVLQQGSGAVRAMYEDSFKHSAITKENTDEAKKNQEAWARVSTELQAVQNQIANQLLPIMEKLANKLVEVVDYVVKWDQKLNGGIATAALLVAGVVTLTGVMGVLTAVFGAQSTAIVTWTAALAGALVPLEKLVAFAGAAKAGLVGATGAFLAGYSPELNAGEEEELKRIREEDAYRRSQMDQEEKGASTSDASAMLRALDEKYGLPPGTMDKLWETESARGKNMGPSSAGATGHFQFMSGTASQYGLTTADTYDFKKSSEAAARYMADLLKQNNNNMAMALASYNWGPGNVAKYGLGAAPLETQNYLKKFGYSTGVPTGAVSNVPIGAGSNLPAASGSSSTNVTTSIQNMPIYTQATDANGIADDIGRSISNNQLINFGLMGNN